MRLIDADAFDKCLSGAEIEATKSRKYVFSSAINTIRGNLANFPTVNQWIPCSERLPDDTTYENHFVVVYCTKSGTVDVGWYEAFFKKWWRLEPDEEIREEVIAWMPLPDAYEEDD